MLADDLIRQVAALKKHLKVTILTRLEPDARIDHRVAVGGQFVGGEPALLANME